MKTIIKKYGFDGVWHFTNKSNLESIQKHNGLLSLSELENRNITIPAPGGNDWSHDADRMKGLDFYVHLAFVDDHPMLFRAREDERIKDPVWLKIRSEIILGEDVRFCSDVSNKSGVCILNPEEAKEEIDFEVLYTYMDWRNPEIQRRRQAAIKSEILIPRLVPIDMILGFKNG
ncbi:MAG TPA: DarT ssDNA thymidine ADP-ribosyltransferase family protein [Saprospiraceae bacterium]|nr:DarT ssDNA thymidine ADP-ribosyltransferase family protein [Saprospiraceae bacterium]